MTGHLIDSPECWWHEDRHGVHGPEASLLHSSLACSVETARKIPRALAEEISGWVRDEGRHHSPEPEDCKAPTGALRARLVRIRRRLAALGLNIRRTRHRRWWFAFPLEHRELPRDVEAALPSVQPVGPGTVDIYFLDKDLLPRAEESLRRVMAGKRRVTRSVAIAACILALREALYDPLDF